MLRVILNVIWLIFAGLELFVAYAIAGVIMAITVVGVPFAIQAFKLAGFVIWPFGRVAVPVRGRVPVASAAGNILWLVLVGWWLALAHLLFGFLLCLTIIGIPMGIASFKMIGMALWPFGRTIVDASTIKGATKGTFYVD
jgi:uncharacterized membrane protein YccF (DUF307 family)